MLLGDAKRTAIPKPFYTDNKLTIFTLSDDDERIVGFRCSYAGQQKDFMVVKDEITKAFKEMEVWLFKQK